MATQTSAVSCTNLVDAQEAKDFVQRCIEKCGAPAEYAACLADVIIAADLRGHYSHGLNRLEMYTKELLNGQCIATAGPAILKETSATAYVDAQNGIGTVGIKLNSGNEIPRSVFRWPGSFVWNWLSRKPKKWVWLGSRVQVRNYHG